MSFFRNDTKLTEALQVLQPMPATILKSRPMVFDDATYEGFQDLLDDAMRQVMNVYMGSQVFVVNMKRTSSWSHRQSRAIANIFIQQLRNDAGLETKDAGNSDGSSGRSASAPKTWERGPQQPEPQGPAVAVLPEYVPEKFVDLRRFPSGRFAVHFGGEWRFFIITELKRRSRLRGRYVWTKNRYANEILEVGDRTVREQAGDTKKFIGKQRIEQPVYFGEEEELIQRVSFDPAGALRDYGIQLGKCGYCGRSLTDPLSRSRGIGPDCWQHKHEPFIHNGKINTTPAKAKVHS